MAEAEHMRETDTIGEPAPTGAPPRLGEMLVARGACRTEDVQEALRLQGEQGGRLGEILMRMGAVDEDDLLSALAEQLDLPVAEEDHLPGADAVHATAGELGLASTWLAVKRAAVWIGSDDALWCAARDPLDSALQETLQMRAGARPVRFCLTRGRLIEALSAEAADLGASDKAESRLYELAEDAPTVSYVDSILSEAAKRDASDIHFEPGEGRFQVRLRVDGVLRTHAVESRPAFEAVSSRIKLISGMDIAERRLPQDGRMSKRIGGERIDFRVSSLPGALGESIVMRLLRPDRGALTLDQLGMEGDHEALFSGLVTQPNGVILVTGPTGSGKTTTLYAALQQINDGRKKIVTVEDPVEYELPGITQVQVRSDIGYDFARALRAILRQDPDVIMVGEIRDVETARIAIQAALTGHLVLSTVHTNDALSAVTRMMDMGVEPFLIAAAVRGVVAQRLVRRLDPAKAERDDPPSAVRAAAPDGAGSTWMRARVDAHDAAFSGRMAVYEMSALSPALAEAVGAGRGLSALRDIARREGMRSLREDALLKASRGLTSAEEALRVGETDEG